MSSGLEGIVVADTVLSHADPVGGNLWIRGVPLAKLVTQHCYEGATALLWEGFAGDGLTREAMQKTLGAERDAAFVRLGTWLPGAPCAQLDEAVRTCLAALPDEPGASGNG